MTHKKVEDCLSCKITSICCLFGIGSYLLFTGKGQQATYKYSLLVLGVGCIGLGVGEIFDKSPFRNYKKTDLPLHSNESKNK